MTAALNALNRLLNDGVDELAHLHDELHSVRTNNKASLVKQMDPKYINLSQPHFGWLYASTAEYGHTFTTH